MNLKTHRGRIINSKTKEFIQYAEVTLEIDGNSYVVYSDSQGIYKYEIQLKQEKTTARIRIDADDYKTITRDITIYYNNDKIEDFLLTPILETSTQTANQPPNQPQTPWKNWGDNPVVVGIGVIGTLLTIFTVFSSLLNTNPQEQQVSSKTNCDPAYPSLCISLNSPNLKCSDIKERDFKVLKPDPHGFDRDGNGIGCEK
jgi:hypothetical protein